MRFSPFFIKIVFFAKINIFALFRKYDQKVLDFLTEKDYQISPENLKIDDIFNILSGRISDKILLRLFNGQEIHPLFEDFSDDHNINIKLPFEMLDTREKKEGNLREKTQKSSISQDLVKMFQKKYSTRYGSSILQKTPTFTSRSLQEIYDEIGYFLYKCSFFPFFFSQKAVFCSFLSLSNFFIF